jgi:hypothetical protein
METTRCKSSTLANFPWLRLSTIWWRNKQFTNTKIRLFSSGWSNFLQITHRLWKSWNAGQHAVVLFSWRVLASWEQSKCFSGTWIQKPVRYVPPRVLKCHHGVINHWISHNVIESSPMPPMPKQQTTVHIYGNNSDTSSVNHLPSRDNASLTYHINTSFTPP